LSCTAIIPARNTVNFTFVFAPVTGGPLNQTDGSVVGSETGYTWGAQVSWGQYGSTPVPTGFTFSQVDVFMDCGSGTSTFELYIYDPNNGSAYLDQHQTVPCLGGIPHDIGFSFSPITINDGKLVLSVQTFNAGGVYVGGTNSQPFANFYDGINPQYGNYFNGSIPQWPKILFNRVPPPAVLVNATFNGNVWPASGTGSVGYSLQGPSGTVSGTGSVPFGASNLQPGSYTLTYNGGGPANGTMTGILPCGLLTRGSSCTANLNAGQTLPFTLQFTWLGQTDGSVIATYNSSRIADDWKEIGLDLSVPANTTITKATFYASANCSGSRTYRVIFVDSNWGTIQDNYFTAPCGGTTPQQVDYTLPTPLTWSGDLKVIFQIQGLAGYNMYFAGSNTGTYRDMWCNDWSCGFFPRFSLSVYGR
jgi:hypothetical protein